MGKKAFIKVVGIFILMMAFSIFIFPAGPKAATEEQIQNSINSGVAWLVSQQNPTTGSWGTYDHVAHTGFDVVKLEDRAYELGYESPFDPEYEYSENVINGLNYIFSQALYRCSETGIAFSTAHETYNTGIAMMAIAASRTPDRVVNVAGSAVHGWTYLQVLTANVEYFRCAQNADGAWRYWYLDEPSDQSNTGYAVLGLSYAEAFGVPIPDSIRTGLANYINYIQCDDVDGGWSATLDGGSGYVLPCSWVNELKGGNLIYEMCFVGEDHDSERFQRALAYIERHWHDANIDPGWGYNYTDPNYQAMYTLMKGLEYCSIDLLDLDGDTVRDEDWFNQEPPLTPPEDFASVIVQKQTIDDNWTGCYWGNPILCTEWALLTLEKIAPEAVISVHFDIKPGSCPNPLNVKSKGVLPVAILGTEDFDVHTIDPATVRLTLNGNGDGAVAPLRWAYEDVATPFEGELCDCHDYNGDGYMDMTFKFKTQEIVETLGLSSYSGETIPLAIIGDLMEDYGGTPIYGQDCVWILEK